MAKGEGIDLIWSAYVKNKKRGFDGLYASYYEQLLVYCMGKLRHLDLAEDAVAEIFIKILSFEKPETIESPNKWIFTLAKNHCLSYWNKLNRRDHILSEILPPSKQFRTYQMDDRIDLKTIQQLISDTLDEDESKIWNFALEGFSNSEIAEKLAITAKTVANKKSMIRDKLKEVLKENLGIERNN